MINKKFQENSFIKMAALSALLFFVVVLIIEAVFGLFKGQQISEALSKYSNTGYLTGKIIGAIVYGLVISYFYKRKAKKVSENQKK
ncbi:MAG: hypothetical protein DSY82_07315 [Flavobacteriia bacterium]|nr:MAG: hypothetical protein DSY82_07315 [Flavobacteriia bacterium]